MSKESFSSVFIDPMKYTDIGKNAFDVLSKDYPANIVRLEVSGTEASTQSSISKISANASTDIVKNTLATDVQNVLAFSLKNPLSNTAQPLIFESQSKIDSQGNLEGTLEIKDPYFKGLSSSVTSKVSKDGGFQTKLGFTYSNAIACRTLLHSNLVFDFSNGPILSKSVALKYREYVFGSSFSYNNTKGAIDNHSYAFGVEYPCYKFSLHANNGGSSIAGALYQKFPSGAESGFVVTHTSATSSSLLEFGCKAKMDHTGKAAVSYTSRISDRVSMTLAAAFDSLAPNDLSSRKLGCSISMNL